MQFLSFTFIGLLLLFFIAYQFIPVRFRYIPIAMANICFYLTFGVKGLLIFLSSVMLTYIGGVILYRIETPIAYNLTYGFFFVTNIGILVFYKVLLAVPNLVDVVVMPIGLSFFVFQTCTYLGDVYHKKIEPEVNPVKYLAFAMFFPTILMGPIQKARNLLPQLEMPRVFNFDDGRKALCLFIWGGMQKIVIADRLKEVVDLIYDNYHGYSGLYYVLAAVCFSIYIYADFSAYSDMSRGIAKLFGVDVGRNFKNPYLSESVSDFWRNWHVSLYEWFKEYVYIPLGGNRKGEARLLLNIVIVFLLSGLWHGSSINFLIWGLLNGILVITEEYIGYLKRNYRGNCLYDLAFPIRFVKKALVFLFITFTWIFFRNDVNVCQQIIYEISKLLPNQVALDLSMLSLDWSRLQKVIILISVFFFFVVQMARVSEDKAYSVFCKMPILIQSIGLALVAGLTVVFALSCNVAHNDSFIYFNF